MGFVLRIEYTYITSLTILCHFRTILNSFSNKSCFFLKEIQRNPCCYLKFLNCLRFPVYFRGFPKNKSTTIRNFKQVFMVDIFPNFLASLLFKIKRVDGWSDTPGILKVSHNIIIHQTISGEIKYIARSLFYLGARIATTALRIMTRAIIN